MSRQHAPTINESVDFQPDELFFSTTDKRGIIQTGNAVFVRVSGFTKHELVGAPHNIIRHPDMPQVVFKLFWDTIEAGKPISAFVKNRSKSGRYYWVVANAYPLGDRYLSVRFKPTSNLLPVVENLYAQMLEKEAKGGMSASGALLTEALASLGFASYEAFQRHLLYEEIKSLDKIRHITLDQPNHTTRSSTYTNTTIDQINDMCDVGCLNYRLLFSHLSSFRELSEQVSQQTSFLLRLSKQAGIHSINTSIASARLGNEGRMLGAISEELRTATNQSAKSIRDASSNAVQCAQEISKVGYSVCSARLFCEIIHFYAKELKSHQLLGDVDTTCGDSAEIRCSMGDLTKLLETHSNNALEQLASLDRSLQVQMDHTEAIERMARMLDLVRTVGNIELSWIQKTGEFRSVFDHLAQSSSETRAEITSFQKAGDLVLRALKEVRLLGQEIKNNQSGLFSLIEKL